jgi:hypothetical protein
MEHLRDLSFDALIERVVLATDTKTGKTPDVLIQDSLVDTPRPERVGLLRAAVTTALVHDVSDPTQLDVKSPLVEALVRVLQHPRRPGLPSKIKLKSGADGLPRVLELVRQHPELRWDPDRIQNLLVQAVRDHADRTVVDDGQLPWELVWGGARSSARVLWTFVTLRALGDLDAELAPARS